MNGESAFGWLKFAAVLAVAYLLYSFAGKFFAFFTTGAGYNNPLKRAGDKVATTLTGRDETVGGWLNELLDPNSRKVAALSTPLSRALNPITPRDNYIGDFAVDTNAGAFDEGTARMQSLPPII